MMVRNIGKIHFGVIQNINAMIIRIRNILANSFWICVFCDESYFTNRLR